jgi:hypothetical protein
VAPPLPPAAPAPAPPPPCPPAAAPPPAGYYTAPPTRLQQSREEGEFFSFVHNKLFQRYTLTTCFFSPVMKVSVLGTGTVGTGTFCRRGTGTVIRWKHRGWQCFFLFPSLSIFSLWKSLLCKKKDFFKQIFFMLCFYGLDTESEPEPLLVKSRDWNHNLIKVGTRTAKNSYGSATLGGCGMEGIVDSYLSRQACGSVFIYADPHQHFLKILDSDPALIFISGSELDPVWIPIHLGL